MTTEDTDGDVRDVWHLPKGTPCERCEGEMKIQNITDWGRERGDYWTVCTTCSDKLFDGLRLVMNASKIKKEAEDRFEKSLEIVNKQLSRYHKLFGIVYIKI